MLKVTAFYNNGTHAEFIGRSYSEAFDKAAETVPFKIVDCHGERFYRMLDGEYASL